MNNFICDAYLLLFFCYRWTGIIGDRTGVFPSNYVQGIAETPNSPYYAEQGADSQNYSDDIHNQEEADTEVSEINTQSKEETMQDTYNRPMSTSSTTSVS